MTTEQRHKLRRLQDRLLELLKRRPAYRLQWDVALWPGGPSADDLGRMLFPEHESELRQMVRDLEA